jgi:hypothetical protein
MEKFSGDAGETTSRPCDTESDSRTLPRRSPELAAIEGGEIIGYFTYATREDLSYGGKFSKGWKPVSHYKTTEEFESFLVKRVDD